MKHENKILEISYRRTATSTNSIYFTNYLEAVLCSYLKEKKCIMINVFSFMIQIFWMIMREALFAKMYSNTNWFFRDYNKLIHKVKFICCSYEQIFSKDSISISIIKWNRLYAFEIQEALFQKSTTEVVDNLLIISKNLPRT